MFNFKKGSKVTTSNASPTEPKSDQKQSNEGNPPQKIEEVITLTLGKKPSIDALGEKQRINFLKQVKRMGSTSRKLLDRTGVVPKEELDKLDQKEGQMNRTMDPNAVNQETQSGANSPAPTTGRIDSTQTGSPESKPVKRVSLTEAHSNGKKDFDLEILLSQSTMAKNLQKSGVFQTHSSNNEGPFPNAPVVQAWPAESKSNKKAPTPNTTNESTFSCCSWKCW